MSAAEQGVTQNQSLQQTARNLSDALTPKSEFVAEGKVIAHDDLGKASKEARELIAALDDFGHALDSERPMNAFNKSGLERLALPDARARSMPRELSRLLSVAGNNPEWLIGVKVKSDDHPQGLLSVIKSALGMGLKPVNPIDAQWQSTGRMEGPIERVPNPSVRSYIGQKARVVLEMRRQFNEKGEPLSEKPMRQIEVEGTVLSQSSSTVTIENAEGEVKKIDLPTT
jgi:hypothetical protein